MRAGLRFFLNPKIYTWQQNIRLPQYEDLENTSIENTRKSMGVQEKLNSIVLNVTTGKLFSPKQLRSEQKKENYQVATFVTGERRKVKRVDY
jgi:hypothetical protein